MDVKKGDTVLALGTKKGVFVAASKDRRRWRVAPWGFEGASVYRAVVDGKDVWAGVSHDQWGPSIHKRGALRGAWKAVGTPKYAEGSGLSVERIWQIERHGDALYAGVEPAGLFVSRDDGKTWSGVEAFNDQPSRKDWMPGGGGLCLHTILPHPGDASRMIVAASAVGIFETRDGGKSWRVMNGGIRNIMKPEGAMADDELGACPHKLVRDASDPGTLYMQNHVGVYRRKDGDAKWTPIERGLPGRFGFPMVATGAGELLTIPLKGDFNRVVPEGKPAVYKTTDGGRSWSPRAKGLPKEGAWWTVLRDAMAVDARETPGVYFGTTTGELYASRDAGESWSAVADGLPPILSVSAGVAG